MRKRKYLLAGVMALAASVAVTGFASGATRSVTQSLLGDISPVKLPKRTFKNAKLHVLVAARDSADSSACTSASPPADGSCRVPPGADLSNIDFDNDIKFNTNSVGKCSDVTGRRQVDGRGSQCGRQLPGRHRQRGRLASATSESRPSVGDVPATVSAFNGQLSAGGKPTIILNVDPGFAPFHLEGTLVVSPQPGDYGKRLRVPVQCARHVLTQVRHHDQAGPVTSRLAARTGTGRSISTACSTTATPVARRTTIRRRRARSTRDKCKRPVRVASRKRFLEP